MLKNTEAIICFVGGYMLKNTEAIICFILFELNSKFRTN